MSRPPVDASDAALQAFVEIKSLLEKVERVADRLADNERDVYDELRTRYATFTTAQFEDKTLLEVMLRNVTVRQDLSDRFGGDDGYGRDDG